jgi:hypothetical protein
MHGARSDKGLVHLGDQHKQPAHAIVLEWAVAYLYLGGLRCACRLSPIPRLISWLPGPAEYVPCEDKQTVALFQSSLH